MRQVPALLGIEDHPDLQQKLKSWELRKVLGKIIYRADLEHMYRPLKAEGKFDSKAKARKITLEAHLVAATVKNAQGIGGSSRDSTHA